jgi:hypothetical protein
MLLTVRSATLTRGRRAHFVTGCGAGHSGRIARLRALAGLERSFLLTALAVGSAILRRIAWAILRFAASMGRGIGPGGFTIAADSLNGRLAAALTTIAVIALGGRWVSRGVITGVIDLSANVAAVLGGRAVTSTGICRGVSRRAILAVVAWPFLAVALPAIGWRQGSDKNRLDAKLQIGRRIDGCIFLSARAILPAVARAAILAVLLIGRIA